MTATPPGADLRTLATLAAHDVDCPGGARCHEDLTTDGRYGRYADAVLAAVLPEHRRVVLAEAAEALGRRTDGTWSDPTIGRGIRYAHSVVVMLARESAAAAPPAGASAPVPAGNAPAVPEEADGQRATEGDALTYAEMESERDRLAGELYEAQTELAVTKSKPLFSTRKVMQTLLEALGDPVDEQELILRIDDGLRLADVAQRVIAALALTAAERDVVERAQAWRAARPGPWVSGTDVEFHLFAAVDALPDAGTDQTEAGHG